MDHVQVANTIVLAHEATVPANNVARDKVANAIHRRSSRLDEMWSTKHGQHKPNTHH